MSTLAIDIRPDHWQIVKGILNKHVPQYEVWAFGSRAKWTAKDYSDLDLAIITSQPLPLNVSAALADDFSESDLPWKVDIVDWATTSESFRKIIERDKVVVQEAGRSLGAVDEWREVLLGSVCSKIGSGATPRGGKDAYRGGATALIRSQNIYNDQFIRSGLVFIDDAQADELGNVVVKEDDVLLNITGDSVARCCQVASDVLPARVNQHVAIIRPKPDALDAKFLRYVLVSPPMQAHLLALASAGATRNALTKAMIESLSICAPPIEEQRAIAHILGTLDDKIELNRRMNETLEAMARALFKSWFVDFDGVAAKDMQESELGLIPKGWRVGTIEDLCESITSGGTPARKKSEFWADGKIPWFKTGELHDGPLLDSEEKITETALQNSSCKLWPSGTILFALYASPTVGRLGVLTAPGTSNQAAAGLIAKKSIGLPFLRRILIQVREQLQNIAAGAAQQNINLGILKSHRVVLPPENLAYCYSDIIDCFDEKQNSLAVQSQSLSQLRDILLPKLISGELLLANRYTLDRNYYE
ncbi:MAG: restriction endonuclease subunit S [Burkholderiaceae bacterium]|nr:restriction endonuclease subunit S [Burkholderiaceae bacterium]